MHSKSTRKATRCEEELREYLGPVRAEFRKVGIEK
jgi:hypothetical protein